MHVGNTDAQMSRVHSYYVALHVDRTAENDY